MFMFSKISIHRMFSKSSNWFDSINKIVSTRLSEAQIITRPAKSNGLWCCILLPTILILYNLFYEISDLYKVVSYVSLGLLIYSILFIKFISISCLVLQRPIYGGCVTSGLVSSLFICISMSEGIILSLIFSIPAVWAYNRLLRHMLKVMPQAFTLGEAMVVSQAVVLSLLTAFVDVFWIGAKSPISCVVYSILSTVGLIVTVLYYTKSEYRTWRTVTALSGVGAIYAILVLRCILGYDIIYELISSIFMDRLKRWLIATWVTLTAGAVTLVWLRTRAATKADTAIRKTFHILATLVFVSGILLDLELIRLASWAAFGLLILIEACRKFDVRPFSTFLEPAFNVYCDEKEVGGWALPPLYLVAGLAGPLVLVPTSASHVERLAGVLTVGVGDSAASFFGSRYGYTTWKGTNKTVEGMLANFISQIIVLCLLKMYGGAEAQVRGALWRGTAAAAAAALTEASTDQVDNLILPLISIIAFQLTYFVNIIT